jgi:hypothetical protein
MTSRNDPSLAHFYVYSIHRGVRNGGSNFLVDYVYERTCGTEQAAKMRVAELEESGQEAIYLIDHIIGGGFY